VVCKAIELLVTCKLVISGLNFRFHFRYDQEGNVLLRSAVIHLKLDGRRFIFRVSFPGFVFVLLLVSGLSLARRLLQWIKPLSSRNFRLLAHEVAACKRTKENYEIDGIRCRIVKFAAGSLLKNSPRSKAGQLSRYDFNFYPFNFSICLFSSVNRTKKSKFVRSLSFRLMTVVAE